MLSLSGPPADAVRTQGRYRNVPCPARCCLSCATRPGVRKAACPDFLFPFCNNKLDNISESNVTLGQALDVPLTKKQYKKMKKLYTECPAGTGEATTEASTLVANKVSNFSEASAAPALATNIKVDPLNCVKQTLTLAGNGEVADASVNGGNQEVTLIGRYIKDGKLKKGETADKYRCLGTYNLPTNSQIAYNLTGNSKIEHIIDVCDTGNVNPNEAISVPMTLNTQFTKQDVMVGDFGKVYIPLTKKEYKRVSKLYSRCCGDGSTKCF